ncbi:transmembrane protein 26 [Stomoxys calcitrans]|uniref:Transmembrane protein 26 n=1 Tax=Stomoxys calcitrans TaxID=35570 RepID=A0A1I8PIK3_STOCA|nr:transmembrane protein 26 [Stomoxys calcitrans]
MAKIISTIKATLTRIIFSAHSLIAIWQVVKNKNDMMYWSLSCPLLLLLFEGIFTIFIKKTQEWRWFCPSVFLYLGSIVPAIWLLEFHKVERRLSGKVNEGNQTVANEILSETLGVPKVNEDTWITLIEQFLMLILIVGRWMLPKGDLTRDQLSQLLLVYIGTAADIIEFFDSYKDDSIAKIPLLVYLTLGIWSWSLMQFTIVLSATRARRPRGGGSNKKDEQVPPTDCCNNCCCGIDVWGIVLNVILQDAPFLTFRLLIIFQYDIISYMNVFFTCKNSLVIVLQLYRLYVVNAEFWKNRRETKATLKQRQYKSKRRNDDDPNGIYMISSDRGGEMKRKIKRAKDYSDDEVAYKKKAKKDNKKRKRKDTGYSTASSQNLYSTKGDTDKGGRRKDKKGKKGKRDRSKSPCSSDIVEARKSKHGKKSDKSDKKKSKRIDAVIEESNSSNSSSDSSNSTLPSYEVINEKKSKSKRRKRDLSSSSSSDSSDTSSSESS